MLLGHQADSIPRGRLVELAERRRTRITFGTRRHDAVGSPEEVPDALAGLGVQKIQLLPRRRGGAGEPRVASESKPWVGHLEGGVFGEAERKQVGGVSHLLFGGPGHSHVEMGTKHVQPRAGQHHRATHHGAVTQVQIGGEVEWPPGKPPTTVKDAHGNLCDDEHIRACVGKVDADLMAKIHATARATEGLFEALDADEDGCLNYYELKASLKKLGSQAIAELDRHVPVEDRTADVGLEYWQFLDCFLPAAPTVPHEALAQRLSPKSSNSKDHRYSKQEAATAAAQRKSVLYPEPERPQSTAAGQRRVSKLPVQQSVKARQPAGFGVTPELGEPEDESQPDTPFSPTSSRRSLETPQDRRRVPSERRALSARVAGAAERQHGGAHHLSLLRSPAKAVARSLGLGGWGEDPEPAASRRRRYTAASLAPTGTVTASPTSSSKDTQQANAAGWRTHVQTSQLHSTEWESAEADVMKRLDETRVSRV